ncbi:MAG: hypothetical protein KDD69_18985 [Bdellovibrionales bacterium]|nr:hypothetical protein [Bdellovibrionales bacterium]
MNTMDVQRSRIPLRSWSHTSVVAAVGVGTFSFVSILYACKWILLAINVSLPPSVVGAIALTSALIAASSIARERALVSMLSTAALIATAITIDARQVDTSFDGQMYHQEAMLRLLEGWNPISGDQLRAVAAEQTTRIDFLLEHFPKFPWITGAALAELTGTLEAGKAVQSLLLVAAAFLCCAVARMVFGVPVATSWWLSVLAAGSPIVVAQLGSAYVDGITSLVLLIALIAGIGAVFSTDSVLTGLLATIAPTALALLVNTKLTGLIYGVGLGGSLVVLALVYARPIPAIVLAVGIVWGIVAFGFDPYVRNTLRYGSPVYPVTAYSFSGVTPIEESLIVDQLPGDFVGEDRFSKLGASLFGRSENVHRPLVSAPKWPWKVTREEFEAFRDPDVRIAGFGPLFALILCSALVLNAGLLLQHRRVGGMVALMSFVLLTSTLVNPEAWWARYVPQLWFIPLVIAAGAVTRHSSFFRWVGGAVLMLMTVNVAGIAWLRFLHVRDAGALQQTQLERLADSASVAVQFGQFRSLRARLRYYGVPFHEVAELPCRVPGEIFYAPVNYCATAKGEGGIPLPEQSR